MKAKPLVWSGVRLRATAYDRASSLIAKLILATPAFHSGSAMMRRLPSSRSRSMNPSSGRSGRKLSTGGDFAIRTSIGIEDPVIGWLGALGRRELSVGGAGGRLYLEGLATMLTVHLLRSHGSSERPPIPHRGGLAPRQMRRVLDYIDANLTDELGLVELAAIAELSPHHFGEAFKISVGKSPHRFLT